MPNMIWWLCPFIFPPYWLEGIIQKYEENEDNMENMDEDYKEKIYGAI